MNKANLVERWRQQGATHLTHDSRSATSGAVFVALHSDRDTVIGHAIQAHKQGAIGMVYDARLGDLSVSGLRCQAVTQLTEHWPTLIDAFYGSPSQQLTLIGVTGTNGKTSICHFLAQALHQLGKNVGVLGTMGNGMWPELSTSELTTLPLDHVQRHLAEFVAQGVDIVVMEVSSHGIAQGRVAGLAFDIGVYSNLSQDHLDYHHTMAEYAATKAQFFAMPSQCNVLNVDDNYVETMAAQSAPGTKVMYYGQRGDVVLDHVEPHPDHTQFTVDIAGHKSTLSTSLIGRFMMDNLLAVVSVLHHLKVPMAQIEQVMPLLTAPKGRLERIALPGKASVIIDFAHSPDAMDKVLALLRPLCPGKLWVIFGCGGDRDRGKRPLMTACAVHHADHVILTEDNPRTENPHTILRDMLTGQEDNQKIHVILSRAQAIQTALFHAAQQDWVVLLGKGHETYQVIGHDKVGFDERAVVQHWYEEHAS